MVTRIEGNRPIQPTAYEPIESIKKLTRQPDPVLDQDSLESLSKAISGFGIRSPMNLFGGDKAPKGISLDTQPKLEPPEKFDAKKVLKELESHTKEPEKFDAKKVLKELESPTKEPEKFDAKKVLKELESPTKETEKNIDYQWLEVMRMQRENLEEGNLLRMKGLKDKMSENKELRKAYFDRMDEIIESKKKSKVLGWVDTGLTAALIVSGIAGILFAVFTGGASLVLTAAAAVAGVADGGVKIANGVIKHDTNKKSGELLEISERRKINEEQVNDAREQIKQAEDKVLETWELLGKIERTKQDISLDVVKSMRVL